MVMTIPFMQCHHKSVPQIVISPENTSTVAGSTTVLACVGYGSPSVTWSKDGAVLVNNSQVTIFEDLVTRGGFTFTKSVLQLCDTQDVNSGQYSCSVGSRVLCTHSTHCMNFITLTHRYACLYSQFPLGFNDINFVMYILVHVQLL